jgi:hypothetical protein
VRDVSDDLLHLFVTFVLRQDCDLELLIAYEDLHVVVILIILDDLLEEVVRSPLLEVKKLISIENVILNEAGLEVRGGLGEVEGQGLSPVHAVDDAFTGVVEGLFKGAAH